MAILPVLREIEVSAPAWSDKPVRMREPTIKAWREASRAGDDQDRTIALLGFVVLDENGKPVGVAAIEAAPLAAFGQLAKHLPVLIGEAEEEPGPLTPTSGSSTA
jgi:hypothetical protein